MQQRTKERPWDDLEKVLDAARYAAEQHEGDLRKGTTIPYVSHLWSVAALVLEHGGSDVQVTAALFHDVVEDHGGTQQLAVVRERFGPEVAAIVEALSDSVVDTTAGEEKPPWRERKEQYLQHLRDVSAEVALVSVCDKLHNARCILADLKADGPAVWQRFNVQDPADQLWYYDALADILVPPKVPSRLSTELARTVGQIRDLAADDSARKHDGLAARDLIRAASDAWRWRNAMAPLRDWHRQEYELLRLALNVDFDFMFSSPERSEHDLWELVKHLVVASVDVPDPFGGYLEAPSSIIEFYQRHAQQLQEASEAHRRALLDTAFDALLTVAPVVADRTVSREALVQAGLPRVRPDPLDYR